MEGRQLAPRVGPCRRTRAGGDRTAARGLARVSSVAAPTAEGAVVQRTAVARSQLRGVSRRFWRDRAAKISLVYTKTGDEIRVLDLVERATVDRFAANKVRKKSARKNPSVAVVWIHAV